MTTAISAVFEGGVLRPTAPLKLADGARVELIILSDEKVAADGCMAAAIIAEIAALSIASGDSRTSQDHDRILYGEQGAR